MRYVPTYHLKEDMILGRNLYGRSWEILLTAGTRMKANAIEKIRVLGYCGAYVEEENSKNITINELIPDALRKKAISEARELFAICQKKVIPMQMTKLMEARLRDFTIPLIAELVENIIRTKDQVLNLVDLKIYDEYIHYHSVNVCVLSIMLGQQMGMNEEMLNRLGLSGMLHDIGCVFLGKDLFNKTAKLTKQEFEEMKKHPGLGQRFIKEFYEMPIHTTLGVYQHHERLDGSGYPNGEKGDRIILFSRILGVADAYDALTSDRPYRPAMIPADALQVLREGSGTLYDPEVIEAANRKIGHYPVGMCVELSNGLKGIVAENRIGGGKRPAIKMLKGQRPGTPDFIDLAKDVEYLSETILKIAEP